MRKPLKLKLRTKRYLQRASWSVWIKEFNKVHNPFMFTSVGNVEVKIYEKENSNTKKSKKSNR